MRGGSKAKPGQIFHSISDFVGKEWFIETEVERQLYRNVLGLYLPETDWRCFSFAIMSNHVHLGLVAGEQPLADWLRPMHSAFATWINQRRGRNGAVFVRGPEFVAYTRDGVAAMIDYIHNNPVRAGVVRNPRDSDWSSHPIYCGLENRPSWLDVELGLELAGCANAEALEAWMRAKRTKREDLDSYRVTPRKRRGRPSKSEQREREERELLELHEALMWAYADSVDEAA